MKNIIYLICIVLCISFNNCSAQNTPQHLSDPNSDKFAGTWKWGDANNGLVLVMKKENNVHILGSNDSSTIDAIIGFHKIYKDGIVTEDSTIYSNTDFIDKKKSFIATTSIHESNPNELRVWMTHKKKNIEMKIFYIDSAHIKITEVKNQEGVRVILPGQTPPSLSIDIPQNIVLIKQ